MSRYQFVWEGFSLTGQAITQGNVGNEETEF